MKKIIIAIATLALALGLAPALAGPDDMPGNSQYGRCKAVTNGSPTGQANKYANGEAFRDFDDLDDDGNLDDDGDENTDDLAEAIAYCSDFLSNPDNHPSAGNGQGGGNGRNGGKGE